MQMRLAAIVFIISLAVVSIPTFLNVLPGPLVHDEWAYLLQADTFAHGRLANPPHPHWQFFETMHVLQQPTYAAKFPPLQGALLAIGRWLGDPMYGVLGTIALASVMVMWMLRAVMPSPWAAIGGIAMATHPIVFNWGQRFWGGGAAILAAAVFCGALLRFVRKQSWKNASLVALGLGLLANCRPLEGLLLAVLCAIVVIIPNWRAILADQSWRRGIAFIAIAMVPVFAWMMYYNYRVTHNPLRLPYSEHTSQYMHAPLFWWQGERTTPIEYRHPDLAKFHLQLEPEEWLSQVGPGKFASGIWRKLREITRDWFTPPQLLMPIAAALLLQRNRRVWAAAGVCTALPFIHFFITPWFRPHYMAVLAPAVFGIAATGLRVLWINGRLGKCLVVGFFGVQSLLICQLVYNYVVAPNVYAVPHQELLARLQKMGGQHLVFIRYTDRPQTLFEWVYNTADIDHQQVVFARDMSAKNQELIDYYPNRRVWLVTVNGLAIDVVALK